MASFQASKASKKDTDADEDVRYKRRSRIYAEDDTLCHNDDRAAGEQTSTLEHAHLHLRLL